MRIFNLFCFLFLLSHFKLSAQTDSIVHSPTKATIYSAIVPGLGQAYNKKYWKIPIIYAGIGTSTYFFIYNSKEYQRTRHALINRLDTDSTTIDNDFIDPRYTVALLQERKNYYRKNRDLSAVIGFLFYIANIIDADVDAHMFNFNVDENLSLFITPSVIFDKPSLTFSLNF